MGAIRYTLPKTGAHVFDERSNEERELVVIDVYPGTRAADHKIPEPSGYTVAELNNQYDPGEPVVDAVYIEDINDLFGSCWNVKQLRSAVYNDLIRSYAFPAPRLKRGGEG